MRVAGFEIVFQKLAEAERQSEPSSPQSPPVAQAEYDEIDELRRLALEMGQPEQQTYTIS